MIETIIEPKKETDFILKKCEPVKTTGLITIGFDVTYTNELNGVLTVKSFRVFHMEQLKTIMSSDEIDEVLKR